MNGKTCPVPVFPDKILCRKTTHFFQRHFDEGQRNPHPVAEKLHVIKTENRDIFRNSQTRCHNRLHRLKKFIPLGNEQDICSA